jgi:hypothetical protein
MMSQSCFCSPMDLKARVAPARASPIAPSALRPAIISTVAPFGLAPALTNRASNPHHPGVHQNHHAPEVAAPT